MSIFKPNSDAAKKKQVSDEDTKKVSGNTNSATESKELETYSEQGGIGKLMDKAKLVMKSTLKNTSEQVRQSDLPKKRRFLEQNKSKSDEGENFVDINKTELETLFGCEEADAFIYTRNQVTLSGETVTQSEPESDVISALKRELASQSIPQDNKKPEDECILAEKESESQSIQCFESKALTQGELVKNQKLGSTSEATDSKKSIAKDEEELQDELIAKDQNSNLSGTATGIKQVSKPFTSLKRYKPMKDTKLTIIFLENTSEVASQINNLKKIVERVKNGLVYIINYGSKVIQTELFEATDIKKCVLLVEDDVGDKACLFNALVALEKIVFDSYNKVLETENERMRINKIEVIGIGKCDDNCSIVSKEIGMECFSRMIKEFNILTRYFTLTEESFIQAATIGFRSIGAIYRNYM